MSLSAIITPAILDKILGNLALLFLTSTGGDLPAARHAASRLLADYGAETEEELRLAADIIGFGFHALDALGQAMAPDLPLKDVLSLRGSAVNLNRQSHRSQRKLDQLRRDRLAAVPKAEAAPDAPAGVAALDQPGTEEANGLMALVRDMLAGGGAIGGGPSRAVSNKQRRAARRITETLARNKAEQSRREALATASAQANGVMLQAAE